ncbi:hypothetical protein [Effusibacillus consociatus]|uniref:Uncharacterized protein n=1 Tax=Effusibacillus consociatus TaxID=1117041 RepID=A0ABV9Q028_9BACL
MRSDNGNHYRIPSSIQTYLLSGNQNDIPTIHNEHTGPSDGVVFIDSASSAEGVGNLAGNVTVPLNHLELGWGTEAAEQIHTWLQQ